MGCRILDYFQILPFILEPLLSTPQLSGSAGRSGRGFPRLARSVVLEGGGHPEAKGASRLFPFRLKTKRPSQPTNRPTCKECHFWHPSDVLRWFGECENGRSPEMGLAVRQDRVSADCFAERSYSGLAFAWCGKCRETSPASELPLHAGHDLYVGTAQPRVEDMMEMTVAGD